jgi:type II secretory pathway component PulJ
VEIMLAMIIFALVATSYAAVTLRYATRMKTIAAGAARSAALTEYMNRLMALPFDQLAGAAGCVTVSTGAFPNTRCVTVSAGATSKTVTLILTPARTIIKPDTVVLTRVKATTVNPLT